MVELSLSKNQIKSLKKEKIIAKNYLITFGKTLSRLILAGSTSLNSGGVDLFYHRERENVYILI